MAITTKQQRQQRRNEALQLIADRGHSLTEFLGLMGGPKNNQILFNAVKESGIKDPYVFTLGL